MSDTAPDLIRRHTPTEHLYGSEKSLGFVARCTTCGRLFDAFDDPDSPCIPEKETSCPS